VYGSRRQKRRILAEPKMSNKYFAWVMYLALAVVLFILATVGFGVHSRMVIGGESYDHALSRHMYYAKEQILGTMLLLLPFVILGCIAAWFSTARRVGHGIPIFIIGATLLLFLYYKGHMDSEIAMKNKHWTAAALSIGLVPFQSLGALVLLLIGGLLAGKPNDAKTSIQ
jgi:hypothetical protein